ncbi:hypothetical protein BJ165DRAFT_1512430 [Panaeolus papilionaceus]|nr:hypothetical protein BJ165DRAFT_1512430 [Panaeolus papilionaceus]
MIREYDVVDVGRGNFGGSGLNIGGGMGKEGGEGGKTEKCLFREEMYEVAKVIMSFGERCCDNSIYVLLPTAACRKNIGEFGDAADVMSVTRPTTTPK